jgi:predicted transcriptional regulator
MRTKWSDLKKETMSPAAQIKARKLALRDVAEIEINELREALKVTQTELAGKLKITQAAVSRLEGRKDMHLSTLRDYVHGLGGEIQILAMFADRTVKLTHAASDAVVKNLRTKLTRTAEAKTSRAAATVAARR